MNSKETLIQYAKVLSEAPKIAIPKGTQLYRARPCVNDEQVKEIKRNPAIQLLTNPNPAKQDGRFHKKGQHPLYLANTPETASAEVKKDDTQLIVIGYFSTRRHKTVLSLLPEDYANPTIFPPDNVIHELALSLNEIAHKPDDYSETKEFIDTLKEAGVIRAEDGNKAVFIVRYKSVKHAPGINYFMCGVIETRKLLGECQEPKDAIGFPIPTDYGLLQFEGCWVSAILVRPPGCRAYGVRE
ncbi:MAG: RES family NAD+ phosphorylase [Gammaproteobacteria bacterium]